LGENAWRDGAICTRTESIEVKKSARKKQFGPDGITPTLVELQTALDSVRREVRNLTVMGMDPKQTAEQAALIKELEPSARAEMRLRTMALEYAKGELRSHRHRRGKNAARGGESLECHARPDASSPS
jgi:hypothetical protein